jgi:hypothetical protein
MFSKLTTWRNIINLMWEVKSQFNKMYTIMQMWDAIYGKILRCTMTDTITIETLLVIENKTKIM